MQAAPPALRMSRESLFKIHHHHIYFIVSLRHRGDCHMEWKHFLLLFYFRSLSASSVALFYYFYQCACVVKRRPGAMWLWSHHPGVLLSASRSCRVMAAPMMKIAAQSRPPTIDVTINKCQMLPEDKLLSNLPCFRSFWLRVLEAESAINVTVIWSSPLSRVHIQKPISGPPSSLLLHK